MKHLQTILDMNPLSHFLMALGIAVGLVILFAGLRYFVLTKVRKMSSKTSTHWDNILVETVGATKTLLLLIFSLLLGLLALDLDNKARQILIHAAIVIFLLQCGLSLSRGISAWAALKTTAQREADGDPDNNNYAIIRFVLRLVLWIIVVLLLLDNLGFNVTTLVASLGIGGVAIALAVQNILGDLFASLSIALDKPFLVGDFITVDNLAGTVRHIGLKTTRVASLSGEELVFSNADLLKSRIHNYKKLEMRRIVFTLGVTFHTPVEKLKRIPDMIREIFSQIDEAELDRVHFSKIGQSSLDFEIVYFVNNADYNVYVRIQEAFNLAAMARFAEEKIEFAFPTQTLHIQKET